MRLIGLALIAALALTGALAGCGQSGQTKAGEEQSASGGAFPRLFQVAYRQELTMRNEGREAPAVIVRDGPRTRMEMSSDRGSMIIIVNNETQEAFTLMPAQRRAMRMPLTQVMQTPEAQWAEAAANSRLVGSCRVLSENGREWERTDEDGAHRGCVTNDGILLRASNATEVVWETTGLQRGPQDANLFVVPPGYQVTDLSQVMRGAQDLAEKYRAQTGQ